MDDGAVSEVDGVNRSTWSRVAAEFEIEGWSDPGELAALTFVADQVRDSPVLDLGVGTGRTLSLLRLLSRHYIGLDYTPELVERCRTRHPDVDIRLGDARELLGIPDGSQGLVVFSSNGIDAVDHDDRQRVLASVHRVLRPGGLFVFSTLNKDSALYGAHPGTAPDITWEPGSLLPRPTATDVDADSGAGSAEANVDAEVDPSWLRAVRNWKRLRAFSVDGPEWGMAPFAAHEYGLVTHFITLPAAVAELDRHGFGTEAVFECDNTAVLPADVTSTALYVHLVARRR